MMKKFSEFFKLYRLPIFSGVLIGTSYSPFPGWALFFCYVPLWLFISDAKRTHKEIFIGAWLTQFILTLIGFYWVTNVVHEFGQIPLPLAIVVLLAFCSLIHLYIPLAHLATVWLQKKLSLSFGYTLVSMALILNLSERFWPSIFPWNLGYSLLSTRLPAYHFADIVGFLGLSLWILLMNAWTTHWWKTKRSAPQAVSWVLILVISNIVGFFHGQAW
jgi:apolipoprotein N-acyltransferase